MTGKWKWTLKANKFSPRRLCGGPVGLSVELKMPLSDGIRRCWLIKETFPLEKKTHSFSSVGCAMCNEHVILKLLHAADLLRRVPKVVVNMGQCTADDELTRR